MNELPGGKKTILEKKWANLLKHFFFKAVLFQTSLGISLLKVASGMTNQASSTITMSVQKRLITSTTQGPRNP